LDAKLDGKRIAERPKIRWLDDVQADLKIIGIKRWRRKVQDRSEWMVVIMGVEAKVRGP
jgi:hypothetical protein